MGAGQPPLKEKAKKETHRKAVRFSFLVEARGVEPLSESALTGLSPGAVTI